MAYDIPAFTGTITTISGTQGHARREGVIGYHKGCGKWCPDCLTNGKFHWIEDYQQRCFGGKRGHWINL